MSIPNRLVDPPRAGSADFENAPTPSGTVPWNRASDNASRGTDTSGLDLLVGRQSMWAAPGLRATGIESISPGTTFQLQRILHERARNRGLLKQPAIIHGTGSHGVRREAVSLPRNCKTPGHSPKNHVPGRGIPGIPGIPAFGTWDQGKPLPSGYCGMFASKQATFPTKLVPHFEGIPAKESCGIGWLEPEIRSQMNRKVSRGFASRLRWRTPLRNSVCSCLKSVQPSKSPGFHPGILRDAGMPGSHARGDFGTKIPDPGISGSRDLGIPIHPNLGIRSPL